MKDEKGKIVYWKKWGEIYLLEWEKEVIFKLDESKSNLLVEFIWMYYIDKLMVIFMLIFDYDLFNYIIVSIFFS